MSTADSRQPGGSHYKDNPTPELQHWNVVAAMGWDYYIGQATRYLWRLGKKDDPVLELEKSIHYLEKKLELIKAARAALPLHCCPEHKAGTEKVGVGVWESFRWMCHTCGHRGPWAFTEKDAHRGWVGLWRHGRPWEIK